MRLHQPTSGAPPHCNGYTPLLWCNSTYVVTTGYSQDYCSAEDILLYAPITVKSCLQSDIDAISSWISSAGLSLNLSKTNISMGVTISSNLSCVISTQGWSFSYHCALETAGDGLLRLQRRLNSDRSSTRCRQHTE